MVCAFAMDTNGCENDEAFFERMALISKRIRQVFTEPRWSDRLGPRLKAYVLVNKLLKKNLGVFPENPSEEESIASNRSRIYTAYDDTCLRFLITLIRNLLVHWITLNRSVKEELCGDITFIYERFLHYFTSRFPGLIVTIYELCAHLGISPVRKLEGLILLKCSTFVQATKEVPSQTSTYRNDVKVSTTDVTVTLPDMTLGAVEVTVPGTVITANEYVTRAQALAAHKNERATKTNMSFQ